MCVGLALPQGSGSCVMSEAKEGLTSCVSQHQALLDAVQDLTKDVVRVDAIPTEDIEKVRVRSDVTVVYHSVFVCALVTSLCPSKITALVRCAA